MKKEKFSRKLFAFIILGLFLFSFVMAESTFEGKLDPKTGTFFLKEVDKNAWYWPAFDFIGLGETWQQVIIGLIIIAIIFAGLYDILELTSIFENRWVKFVIAAGLGIIAAITGLVRLFASWAFSIVAGLGTVGIVLEILIAIIIFIGLSFGSAWAAQFAARRRAAKAVAKGTLFAGNLRALKKVAEEAGK